MRTAACADGMCERCTRTRGCDCGCHDPLFEYHVFAPALCVWCTGEFFPTNGRQQYCSRSCLNAKTYRRRKALA